MHVTEALLRHGAKRYYQVLWSHEWKLQAEHIHHLALHAHGSAPRHQNAKEGFHHLRGGQGAVRRGARLGHVERVPQDHQILEQVVVRCTRHWASGMLLRHLKVLESARVEPDVRQGPHHAVRRARRAVAADDEREQLRGTGRLVGKHSNGVLRPADVQPYAGTAANYGHVNPLVQRHRSLRLDFLHHQLRLPLLAYCRGGDVHLHLQGVVVHVNRRVRQLLRRLRSGSAVEK
mmetsp:Transcript_34100/g.96028  ORF Transcript_34100/g.96028 Transcript_34100/m.96028 type:complete len:233 (-) Transcript_34100:182-880(-)